MIRLRARTLLASAILLAGCAGAPDTGRAGPAEVACSQLSFRFEGRILRQRCYTETVSYGTGTALLETLTAGDNEGVLVIQGTTMSKGNPAPAVQLREEFDALVSYVPGWTVTDWGPELRTGGYRYHIVTTTSGDPTATAKCIMFAREGRPLGSGFEAETEGFYCPGDNVVVNEGTAAILFRDIVEN